VRRIEPVTEVVPHQPAGRDRLVAFSYDKAASIHAPR
jgi:hypothetical protein